MVARSSSTTARRTSRCSPRSARAGTTSASACRCVARHGRRWSSSSACSSRMTRTPTSCTSLPRITSASIPMCCTCGGHKMLRSPFRRLSWCDKCRPRGYDEQDAKKHPAASRNAHSQVAADQQYGRPSQAVQGPLAQECSDAAQRVEEVVELYRKRALLECSLYKRAAEVADEKIREAKTEE